MGLALCGPAGAQEAPFRIGGKAAEPVRAVCAPMRDEISRRGLEDLQRGILPPGVPTSPMAKALLELRIGAAEADPAYLRRAIDYFQQTPSEESMYRVTWFAQLLLATYTRDLELHAAARRQYAKSLPPDTNRRSPSQLSLRATLMAAAHREADGLGGEGGRALLRETVARSSELLRSAGTVEQGEELRSMERFHRQLVAQLALLERDGATLRAQVASQRAAADASATPEIQQADLQALTKMLYDLATLVRGEEGLQAVALLRQGFDRQAELIALPANRGIGLPEVTYRGLETSRGQWQIHGVEGDRLCLLRTNLDRQRAMVDVLEQSLRADTGVPDTARLDTAIAALQRAGAALSLQPLPLLAPTLELTLGTAYRLQAVASPAGPLRSQRIDRARAQFGASEQRLRQCFCRWFEEELARERAALDALS
ncbi:hypothetical protein [Variovorax sp. DAIF25]|uniref:hypothetical protein n=1 Tax=Variovorax sp. DAIF25 TaxID=3080983 RepID=UPI003D6C5F76